MPIRLLRVHCQAIFGETLPQFAGDGLCAARTQIGHYEHQLAADAVGAVLTLN